ncbi:MAG: hypothetical protein WCJ97_02745 [Phycisphaerae bacterium]
MKPEEKQELQSNELATWLVRFPMWLKDYGSYVLLAVAVAILVVQLYHWNKNRQEQKLHEAWANLELATIPGRENPPAKLKSITLDYDIPTVQAIALVKLGEFYHQIILAGAPPEGVQGVKMTVEEARQNAQEAYKKVLTQYPDDKLAVPLAMVGLAAVSESVGNWDLAKEQYTKLTDPKGAFANTAFAQLAQRRLDQLEEIKQPVVLGPAATTLPDFTEPTTNPTTVPVTTTTRSATTRP